MSFLSKFQPFFIIISTLIGIFLGKMMPDLERYAAQGIEVFLVGMLFFVFLNVELKEILKSFSDARFAVSALLLNFIVTPLFAFGLSRIFFTDQMDAQIGFIMLLVTPCTDWYLVFTGAAKGNVLLGASILPLNLLLQIILLPVYLLLFMGTNISFGSISIMRGLLFVLILPLAAAYAVKFIYGKTLGALLKKADDIQCVLLCFAIVSMFASQGSALLGNIGIFITLLPALVLFFGIIFCLSLLLGTLLKLPFKNIIPLVFTTSARNSPVALAIAAATFPMRPTIALVLVIGPLIELPALAIQSMLLKTMLLKKSRK